VVGSPTSGRSRAEFNDVVGYFVNPIALRADFVQDLRFEDFTHKTRDIVRSALDHQDYPLPTLIERLKPGQQRSRLPLVRVMFNFYSAQPLDEADLAPFALGESGVRAQIGGLTLESVALERRVAQFDLTLCVAEADGEIATSWQYSTALYDLGTIERMKGHYEELLRNVVRNPGVRVWEVGLLREQEQWQMLMEW